MKMRVDDPLLNSTSVFIFPYLIARYMPFIQTLNYVLSSIKISLIRILVMRNNPKREDTHLRPGFGSGECAECDGERCNCRVSRSR